METFRELPEKSPRMISSGSNPEIVDFAGKTLILYKSESTFSDSGEEKNVFERRICHELLCDFLRNDQLEIHHKPSGSPYIEDSGFHLSISHAGSWFAPLISDARTGVDIQTHTSKQLSKGMDYFVNEREKELFHYRFDDNQLYAIWGAKEAIYKYFEGAISDLRNDITITEIGEKLIVSDYAGSIYSLHFSQDDTKTVVWM